MGRTSHITGEKGTNILFVKMEPHRVLFVLKMYYSVIKE